MVTVHGGPDAAGVPRWDFSTNANACGPAPAVIEALRDVDVSNYPDPSYTALREQLGTFHGVSAERIVVAASASEFIARLSAAVKRQTPHASVYMPVPGYADYGRAADAVGLRRVTSAGDASLAWVTEPGSPHGLSVRVPTAREGAVLVVDEAYAPLRLEGEARALPATAWRLLSPNKPLGLTGVRGAYAIAPDDAGALQAALAQLEPSWPLGGHGVAMLTAWAAPATQQWLLRSLDTLRDWKQRQLALCESLGWVCEPSVTPYFVARWPHPQSAAALAPRLREFGVKLRDATSLGLPGAVRVGVRSPAAQDALRHAWLQVTA